MRLPYFDDDRKQYLEELLNHEYNQPAPPISAKLSLEDRIYWILMRRYHWNELTCQNFIEDDFDSEGSLVNDNSHIRFENCTLSFRQLALALMPPADGKTFINPIPKRQHIERMIKRK